MEAHAAPPSSASRLLASETAGVEWCRRRHAGSPQHGTFTRWRRQGCRSSIYAESLPSSLSSGCHVHKCRQPSAASRPKQRPLLPPASAQRKRCPRHDSLSLVSDDSRALPCTVKDDIKLTATCTSLQVCRCWQWSKSWWTGTEDQTLRALCRC